MSKLIAVGLLLTSCVSVSIADSIQVELDAGTVIRVEETDKNFVYEVALDNEVVRFDLPHTSFTTAIPEASGSVNIRLVPQFEGTSDRLPKISVVQVSEQNVSRYAEIWRLARAFGGNDSNALYVELEAERANSYKEDSAETLINLANLYLSFRFIDDAERAANQVITNVGSSRLEKMHAYLAAAQVQLERNNQTERIELLEQAKALLDLNQQPEESKWLAKIWSENCDSLIFQGEKEGASSCFDRAISLSENWPSIRARTLNNLGGYTAELLNDLEESARLFVLAEKTYRTTGDHYGRALAQFNLGVVYYMKGDYYHSLSSHFSALDHIRLTHNPALEGSIVASIGAVYVLMENYLHAQQFLEQALAQLRAGVPDRSIVAIRSALGDAKRNLGQTSVALDLHQEYVSYHESEIKTKSKWRLGLGYTDLAEDNLALGNLEEAQRNVDRARDFLRDESELHLSAALRTQAHIYLANRQYQAALDAAGRSRSLLPVSKNTLPQQIQTTKLQIAATYHLGDWKNAEFYGLQAIELAEALTESMPESETQFLFRSTLGNVYANLADIFIQQYLEDQDSDHLQRALTLLEQRRTTNRQKLKVAVTDNVLESQLARALEEDEQQAASFRIELDKMRFEREGVPGNMENIQSSTIESESEVFIEYVFSDFSSYRLSVSANKTQLVELRPKKEIDIDISEFLERASNDEFDYDLAKTLGHELIGPIDKLHPNATSLRVSPVGTINHLPITALDIGDATSAYQPLISHYPITLRVIGSSDQEPDLQNADITLVTTTEEYDVISISPEGEARGWIEDLLPLPWAAEEAASISHLFGDNRTTLLAGDSATTNSLMENLRTDILHFATHGYISPVDPDLVGLILTDETTQESSFVGWRNFTNLPTAPKLVFLNGCQTGKGQIVAGEGVLGLVHGFVHSGATTVIATRWNISDRAASQLSIEFYKNLLEQNQPEVALQKAQLALYKNPRFRNPYLWASHALYSSL